MSCECYQIGGPFIAEDPNCPIHGHNGLGMENDQLRDEIHLLKQTVAQLEKRVKELEGTYCHCMTNYECDCENPEA